jgi:hypothetical protein
MATIVGTLGANSVVTVTGASGDGGTVAGYFNNVKIPNVSNAAPTATNASGVVTITWSAASMLCSDAEAALTIATLLATHPTLTAPITITAAQQLVIT